LSYQGYETAAAKDGFEAMELLAQSGYDLVLSDLNTPRIDGLALAQHIVSTMPNTPFFLMTAYDFDDIKAIRQLGMLS
jgi:CheY-like chemotaxis protein